MPLREPLERLHSWLYQHGYIEPRSHSCPVTWTGGPLCSCKSVRLSPITFLAVSQCLIMFLAILVVLQCLTLFHATGRLGPEGAYGAGREVAQPFCPIIPEEVVQPEGGFQQRIWAVSAPW